MKVPHSPLSPLLLRFAEGCRVLQGSSHVRVFLEGQARELAQNLRRLDSVEELATVSVFLAPEMEIPQGRLFAATAAAAAAHSLGEAAASVQRCGGAFNGEPGSRFLAAQTPLQRGLLAGEGGGEGNMEALAENAILQLPETTSASAGQRNFVLLEHSLLLRLRQYARQRRLESTSLGARHFALALQERQALESAAALVKANLQEARRLFREKALAL